MLPALVAVIKTGCPMKVNDTGFFFQKRNHFETSQSVLCRVKTVLDKSLIVMLDDRTTVEIPKSSFTNYYVRNFPSLKKE